MWMGGVFKHYWLESGGWRQLDQSSQMSQDKIFSFSSAEGQVSLALWWAEAAGLRTADGVTTSTDAPALLWIKLSVINPLPGLDNLQQVFKPWPSSICLNHHSSAALENADDRQAIAHSSAAPSYPNHSFHFSLTIVKYRESKNVKMWTIPPHLLSICDISMQGCAFAGQETIPEVIVRKHAFPSFGYNIAVLFHSHGGNETLNNMHDWISLHTTGILKFGQNLTFTWKRRTTSLDLEQ